MTSIDKSHVAVSVVEPYNWRRGLVRQPNEFVRMVPYAFSWPRMVLFCLLVVLSLGTLLVLSVWFPQVFTHLARQRLPQSSLGRAHYVLILVHEDGLRSLWVEVKLHHPSASRRPSFWSGLCNSLRGVCTRKCRRGGKSDNAKNSAGDKVTAVEKPSAVKVPWVWFEFKKHRYAFDADKGAFERYLARVDEDLSTVRARIHKGLSDIKSNEDIFGKNVVDIEEPSIALLVFAKVVHPFYLFQVFSVTVWFVEDYVVYAGVILGMSVVSLAWETYCEVANMRRLRELVHSDHYVSVLRNHTETDIHEHDLVPGDIVIVKTGMVCADMLLLSGICEADEASITGEALPVMKTPESQCTTDQYKASITGEALPVMKTPKSESQRTTDQYKASLLFAGSLITRVIECQGEGDGKSKSDSKVKGEGDGDGKSESDSKVKGEGDGDGKSESDSKVKVVAVVLSTGFSTGKGELLRSILYPRQLTFEFERDSYRYLFVLVAVALAAFIKRLVDAADVHATFGDTVLHSLDLITIAVPPALPFVLSSGISFALARLRRRGVACRDVRRINSCGQLTCFCFDKTGTLTDEHFKLAGAEMLSADGASLQPVELKQSELPAKLRVAMATCHGLSESGQGLMLDKEMFAATRCTLALAPDSNKIRVTSSDDSSAIAFPGYEILERFPFDASVQCASVLVRDLATSKRLVWVKGSVEVIQSISTGCPANLVNVARRHAAEGHYCIGFASKCVSDDELLNPVSRNAVEGGLEFAGLAYFTNKLKPESAGVVAELYTAGLDVRMITGDNAYTALQVARELKMTLKERTAVVDVSGQTGNVQLYNAEVAKTLAGATAWEHFTGASISRLLQTFDIALTGAALDKLRDECEDETIAHLLRNTRLFARIRPQQKTWIVEQLMDMGQTVGMCGDGMNDCGALKAAHVGLALLSGVEASLVAPFTSTHKSVQDVPVLVREGRCAIMTSFLAFKFMVLYPLIQLAMAATLAHFDLVLTNNQYVWDDLAIVLGLSITMLYTAAAPQLSPQRPPRTLFSPTVACSIAGQVAIFLAFFIGHFALLKHQPTSWFCRIDDAMAYLSGDRSVPASCAVYLAHNTPENEYSFEGTAVWLFGHMLFISVAAAFNVTDPFRVPCYHNWPFTALLLAVVGVNLWFLLDTSGVINDTFQLMALPFAFRWKLLVMFVGHLGAAVLWELVATRVLPRFERPEWVQRLSGACGLF